MTGIARPDLRPTLILVGIALMATLTAGTVLGAINLVRLQVYFNGLSPEIKRLHAFFQLVGLMGGFIAGVAFHVLPRMWKVSPPREAIPGTMIAGITLALIARVASVALPEHGSSLALWADALTLVTGTVFTVWIVGAWRASARPASGVDALLIVGSTFWPLGALLWMAGEYPVGNDVLCPLGVTAGEEAWLLGLMVGWIMGMGPRVLPFFMDLANPGSTRAWVVCGTLAIGVALRALALALNAPRAVAGAGLILMSTSFLLWISASDLWGWKGGTRRLPMAGSAGAFTREVVLASVALALGAVGFLADGALAVLGRPGLHAMVYDAARHSVAIGFGLATLMTVSSRLLPTFAGRRLPHPRLMTASIVMVQVGVAARWTQVLAAYGASYFLYVSGMSGLLILAGLLGWLTNLAGVARAPAREPRDS